jgi:hypothetical protein
MKPHFNIEQGSDEWHLIRQAKVGGSTSSQLHVKSDTLLEQLLAEMAEPFQVPDNYVSFDMQRGKDLEPFAVAEVAKYTGLSFMPVGWLQSDECELIGASPDAITQDMTEIVEVKCPNAKTHISYLRAGIVPIDHVDQVVHYFAVHPELQKVHFASYRPECIKPLFVKTITRDSVVNVGTKARPVMLSVGDYAKEKVTLAQSLTVRLKEEINKLNEI